MSQYQAIISSRLPWDTYPGEENRMRAFMVIILILVVALWFLVPLVKLPQVDRHKVVVDTELQKYAVELKQIKPPPPPPPPVKPKTEEKKPTETVQKPAEVEPPEPKAVPQDVKTQQARAAAKKQLEDSGLNDVQDMLNQGIGDATVPKTTGLPDEVGNGTGGANATTDTPGTSRVQLMAHGGGGGNGLAGYSGNVSSGFGGGVAGGKGSKGGSGGNGFALGGGAGGQTQAVKSNIQASAGSSNRVIGKDGKARRSDESIRSVFDVLNSRLNAAYQKALRDNPNMTGAVVLKLVIQPDGTVTGCDIASSELGDPDLEAKIKTIVKSMNFGSEPVEVWSGVHTVNFLPE